MKGKLKELQIVGYTITEVNGRYWIMNEIGEGMSVTQIDLKDALDKFFKDNF